MSVKGLLSAFAKDLHKGNIPLKLDSAGVNDPNQGRKGDSNWTSVPTISGIPYHIKELTTKHLPRRRK